MVTPRNILLIGSLLTLPAQAMASQSLVDLRQTFIQSYDAAVAEPGNVSAALHKALGVYPLYPYLEYQVLRSTLDTQSNDRINDFLQRNSDTPLYGRLLFAWAKHTGTQGQWDQFQQAWERIQKPDTSLKCLQGQYQLQQSNTASAWEQARQLWTVGHSQPDICDPLFDAWLKSDNFTSADALQRYRAALIGGRESLAAYIKRFIKDEQHLAAATHIQALYLEPRALLDQPEQLTADTTNADALLNMAVKRLARSDLQAAIQLWIRDRERLNIASSEWEPLSTYLGVWLSKRFPDTEGRALLTQLDPNKQYPKLTEWRIRLALTDQDWAAVSQLIDSLPDTERSNDRWRYWQAIANHHLQDKQQDALLISLAKERSFYGFMAAQFLGKPYQLNDSASRFPQAQLDTLAQTPAFVRMQELLTLERYSDARSEWNLATAEMTPQEVHRAAHLVSQWGWYHQGIRGAISSKQWNDMLIRFPNPYPELYQRHADSQAIDPAWALAVTRQESAFWMGAKSRVGARGLMQLMPATARATARRHDIPLSNLAALSEPDTNIQLGTAYLGEVAQRFNGNLAYASAAYNAGPSRVSRWLDARGTLPLDIWIETIPYDETRNYVQNVLSFRVIYERMADQPVALFSEQEFATLALRQQE
ncbi:soluble lytic murein transglycosylase [Marinobacterium halophilum]|uniref:Soluble lytic murein transglycosylase n=1 Tax=Marinobacterium halophilum TaxID=267374 RepID=A0A2P8EZI0_9GAMM|nr:transglycosylase SLT domain-containing protein [Marinobacterium halophilum]PSL14866.1 soluble lytic murein transglycosylase [Marinobacterium halophilum]